MIVSSFLAFQHERPSIQLNTDRGNGFRSEDCSLGLLTIAPPTGKSTCESGQLFFRRRIPASPKRYLACEYVHCLTPSKAPRRTRVATTDATGTTGVWRAAQPKGRLG